MSRSNRRQDEIDRTAWRRGVVAVCSIDRRFLVIRRSRHVEAPGAFCFPGGAIEPKEAEADAIIREMQEELQCDALPVRRLWRSSTAWQVKLSWWQVTLPSIVRKQGTDKSIFSPNPREVESVHWLTEEEMRALPELLSSNREFLDALRRREFILEHRQG